MRTLLVLLTILLPALAQTAAEPQTSHFEYRLLATTKTSTMEKEMNEAADAGYSFSSVMGGETGLGGKEVVVIMARPADRQDAPKKRYKLLATNKTSTLQKEMQEAGDEGFDYCGQTVFESAFGGKETSVILEYDPSAEGRAVSFRLLATTKTSTMQRELNEAGQAGFELMGVMVGKTSFGGKEVLSILRKRSN
ncbi:MAG: hypothetical protein H7Y20_03745 [Bryobacteraceae bacterium]|nr:hypothetical protein [Bryobacteraceae bacterium]